MKRFQLCASVTALIIGIAVAGNVQAADKGHGQNGGKKTSMLSNGGQSGGIANSLNKQGKPLLQKSNGTSNLMNKKLDAKQLIKKDNGPPGGKQQMTKKMPNMKQKEHFNGIKNSCYFGKNTKFWTKSCWNPSYGCETYFCSTRNCWYFWYQPYACYLPCDYWNVYCEPIIQVTQPVVEVTQPVVEVAQPVVEVAQPVVEVAPTIVHVKTIRVVRPYVVYAGPGFGFCGTPFRHVRY